MDTQGFTRVPFPDERKIVIESGRLSARRHLVYGLLEIDVTKPRQAVRSYKARTGENLSFTAFIVACLGKTVEAYKWVHAYRDWAGRLVLFDDVDVVTLIETEKGGVALPHIIRSANRKTIYEIHKEIRAIQAQPGSSQQKGKLMKLGQKAPAFTRSLFYWALRRSPYWMKRFSGTTIVTSVGMFGQGSGWALQFIPMHTMGLAVGGIAEKPGVVDGRIEIREYLCLTAGFDHDIVDGAPAARCIRYLKELIESGYGLEQEGI